MSENYLTGIERENFNEEQLIIIDQGIELGFTEEQMKVCLNPKFSWEQMYEIQQGFERGLSLEQVKTYADPANSYEQMNSVRLKLENEVNLNKTKDALIGNENVREVINILKKNGMNKEANEYLSVLSQIDVLSTLVGRQEDAIHNLEGQLQDLKKPSIKERAEKLLDDVKRDIQSLKENVHEIKNNIVDGAIYLKDTFYAKGKIAFFKAFKEISHDLKNLLISLKGMNDRRYENINNNITKLDNLRKETRTVGTGLKNIGRLILGREIKDVSSDNHRSGMLDSFIVLLNKHKKVINQLERICLNCISKLTELEKSFVVKTSEAKHDLNTLIDKAASRKRTEKTEPSKQKEADIVNR